MSRTRSRSSRRRGGVAEQRAAGVVHAGPVHPHAEQRDTAVRTRDAPQLGVVDQVGFDSGGLAGLQPELQVGVREERAAGREDVVDEQDALARLDPEATPELPPGRPVRIADLLGGTADPIVQNGVSYLEEFALRPMSEWKK